MFDLFGTAHLGALAATLIAALLLGRLARTRPLRAHPLRLSAPFAAALLVNELLWFRHLAATSELSLATSLPLHLCDITIAVAIVALLTENQVACEIAYFWGVGGSLQALLTPALAHPFPRYEFFHFFLAHGGVLSAAVYLTFGRGRRPLRGAVLRGIAITAAYTAVVGSIDHLLSANYLFLCRKPGFPSLLDLLGPWPWYLIPLCAVGALSIAGLYLPFYLADARKRKRPGPGG